MTRVSMCTMAGLLVACTADMTEMDDATVASAMTLDDHTDTYIGALVNADYHELTVGARHACAIDACGAVHCWGLNHVGQASAPSGDFMRVAAGELHTCALRTDGSVHCWGDNALGQRNAPAGSFVDIQAGANHTCALDASGNSQCWGATNGSPPHSAAGTTNLVVGGSGSTCAQHFGTGPERILSCWGGGLLAPSTSRFQSVSARQTSLGRYHGCTVTGRANCAPNGRDGCTGQLLCWGDNRRHQTDGLGMPGVPEGQAIGTLDEEDPAGTRSFPASGSGLYGWRQVAAGYRHTCGINDAWKNRYGTPSNVLCFGLDFHGNRPPETTPPAIDFQHVAAGSSVTCGIDRNNEVHCWGFDGGTGILSPNLPTECLQGGNVMTPTATFP